MRIVIAEDNTGLASALVRAFRQEGHAAEWFADGVEADEHLAGAGADLAILDINLPRLDGIEILRRMRRRGQTAPVLILTARSEGLDRVAGLDAGADDYVVKPFLMDELMARVRALARRRTQRPRQVERIGGIEYDRGAQRLRTDGAPVELSPRERALFELLLDESGHVVSKTRIATDLYGHGAGVEENAVELAVSRLRRKLGTGATIRTIRGLGYMLDPNGEG